MQAQVRDDATRALVALGYSSATPSAVRQAIDEGGKGMSAAELIRSALGKDPRIAGVQAAKRTVTFTDRHPR
jgi:Holliday junction resolvasome RuvABC DNA-binding subunit